MLQFFFSAFFFLLVLLVALAIIWLYCVYIWIQSCVGICCFVVCCEKNSDDKRRPKSGESQACRTPHEKAIYFPISMMCDNFFSFFVFHVIYVGYETVFFFFLFSGKSFCSLCFRLVFIEIY